MLRHLTALVFALAAPLAFAKGDIAAGEAKAKSTCQACHGADGNGLGTPETRQYPKLAGQYASYLSRALHDYKSGARSNPIMAGLAGPLSDQEIEDLAAYFAAQGGSLHDLTGLD